MRRLIGDFFPASLAIWHYKSSNHLSRFQRKVSKTAKLNMTKLLAVASCEIGGKTKIKSWIPAKTNKEKNKQVKANLLT